MRRQLYVSALFSVLSLFFLVDNQMAQQGQKKGNDLKIEIEGKYLERGGFRYGLEEAKAPLKKVAGGKLELKAYFLVYKIDEGDETVEYFYELKNDPSLYEISTQRTSDKNRLLINVGFLGISLDTMAFKKGFYLVNLGEKKPVKSVRDIFKSLATQKSAFRQRESDLRRIKFVAINILPSGSEDARKILKDADVTQYSRLLFILWDTTVVKEFPISLKKLENKSRIVPLLAEELAEEKSITEVQSEVAPPGVSDPNPEISAHKKITFLIKFDHQNEMNFEAIKQDLEANFEPAIEVKQKAGKYQIETKDKISLESRFVLKKSRYFKDTTLASAENKELLHKIIAIPFELRQTNPRRAGEQDPEFMYLFEQIKDQFECYDQFGKAIKPESFHSDKVFLPGYWAANIDSVKLRDKKYAAIQPSSHFNDKLLKINLSLAKKEVKFDFKGVVRGKKPHPGEVELSFMGQAIQLSGIDTLMTAALVMHPSINYTLTIKNQFYEKIIDKVLVGKDYQSGLLSILLEPRYVSISVKVKEIEPLSCKKQPIKFFRFTGEREQRKFDEMVTMPMPELPKQIELYDPIDQKKWEIVDKSNLITERSANAESHTLSIRRKVARRDFAVKLNASQAASLNPLVIKIDPCMGERIQERITLDANQKFIPLPLDWPIVAMEGEKARIEIEKPSGYDIVEKNAKPLKLSSWKDAVFVKDFAPPDTLNLELKRLSSLPAFFVDITEVSLNRNSLRDAIMQKIEDFPDKNETYIFISNGQERASGTGADAKNILQKMFLINMLAPSFYQELNTFREEIKHWEGNTKRRPLAVHFFISSKTYEWIQVDLKLLQERLRTFDKEIDNEKSFYFYADGAVAQKSNGFGEYKVIQVKNDHISLGN